MSWFERVPEVVKQFFLLVWKNLLLQIRRPIGTAFEILLPISAVVIILILRVSLFGPEDRCFVTFDSDPLTIPSAVKENDNNTFNPLSTFYYIYYTPKTNEAEEVVNILRDKVNNSDHDDPYDIMGFDNEAEMVENLDAAISETNKTLSCFFRGAGIVFQDLNQNVMSYKIRLRHEVGQFDTWFTERAAPSFELPGPRVDSFYLEEGFLHLQQLVGEAIIQWRTKEAGGVYESIDVEVRQFPFPSYTSDLFLLGLSVFLPLLLIIGFLYSAGVFVKELVLEKETRVRESMLMMGLQQWILWSTWYLKQFVFLLISAFIMTIFIKFGVFTKSDFFLILIYFILFILSMVSFCFLVSVLFNTARVGFIVGFVAWFGNYLPYLFIPQRYADLSLGTKLTSCVLSNTCMGLGFGVISQLEVRQEGLTWDNFGSEISLDDNFRMVYVFIMLIFDSIIYMILAWYIDGVKPGEYGVPKPFYFPFLPSYWCGKKTNPNDKQDAGLEEVVQEDPSAHEPVSDDLVVGISIQNLTKIYAKPLVQWIVDFVLSNKKPGKKAVDNLNLKMYKEQITALLGHNGAGKTTTMSILTGLFTPTAGTAKIRGYDITTEVEKARESLGICPQYNILFDRLTVSEHLRFYLRLKGIYDKEHVKNEVDQMIEDLQLLDKRNVQSSNLSGGMKRKLSVGIALIGGSEIVILDEPTSGMDPYARRATWDLLTKHKKNRTIVLSTHFMDEADLLGDRIAIMANGRLCCSGSSLFLKGRYGVGYHMTIVKEPNCVSSEVESLIKSFIPDAKQVTDVGAELSFILPSNATPQFPELFDSLEARKSDLGMASFGVSVTTMEEVFIKVGEGTDETLDDRLIRKVSVRNQTSPPPINEQPPAPEVNVNVVETSGDQQQVVAVRVNLSEDVKEAESSQDNQLSYNFVPNTGIKLWLQQFRGLIVKRFYNTIRFYGSLVSQFVLPLLFVLVAMILVVTVPSSVDNDEPRTLLIENSGLSSDDTRIFYTNFRDVNANISFSDVSAADIGATSYSDYTDFVMGIINEKVKNTTKISDCCGYNFQILDQFCANKAAEELDRECNNEGFGYEKCKQCLRCTTATDIRNSLRTCSSPNPNSKELGDPESEDFCPRPPSINVATVGSSVSGRLNSQNIYVAEYILEEADRNDAAVFFRRLQAGFTVTSKEPILSVCNCKTNDSMVACRKLNKLNACPIDGEDECTLFSSAKCPSSGTAARNDICMGEGCYFIDAVSRTDVQEKINKECSMDGATDNTFSATHFNQTDTASVTVWYNNGPYHMSAAALNAFHNVHLRQSTENKDLRIQVINHPLPRNLQAQVDAATEDPSGFFTAIMVSFGYSFLLASFVLFLVNEKESKAKHLQFVSGVSPTSYWLSSYAWDLFNALFPVVITMIIIACFSVDAYKLGAGWAAIFLVLILVCWASIPFTYVFSFFFSNSLAAFGILMLVFFFVSLVLQIVVFVVQITEGDTPADVLHYFFLLLPTYGLTSAFNDIYINENTKQACEMSEMLRRFCAATGVRFVNNPLSVERPGVGVACLYLVFEGLFLFILTLLIQYKFFIPDIKRLLAAKNESHHTEITAIEDEDSDVYAERKKVLNGQTTDNDVVIIKELVKVYAPTFTGCGFAPPKTAVAGLNLAIPNGECFGLLGVNGAGKTTTFSMLTGDIPITGGSGIIAGHDIKTDLKEVQQRLGYCPQFDALIERMTARELLTMYSRLRGIPEDDIPVVVETEIRRLDLKKHCDKPCGSYSGGNKRKLSTAIALVGNPPIVMLDEPTTGMDPNTRRYLWDVLTGVTQEGRSIILTSHSMEECEALCTRLAIMVNGRFKCLGSIQHLKNKFGSGYTLQVKVKLSAPPVSGDPFSPMTSPTRKKFSLRRTFSRQRSGEGPTEIPLERTVSGSSHHSVAPFDPYDTTALHNFIKDTFPDGVLKEEHQGSVTYQLPSAGMKWSTVFREIEANKERLGIVDYSVSQTTLDQVFVNFAKEQDSG